MGTPVNNGDTCAKSCVFNNEKVTRHGEPINTNLDQIACTQYPQQQKSFGLIPQDKPTVDIQFTYIMSQRQRARGALAPLLLWPYNK